jgi:hypothetical protein
VTLEPGDRLLLVTDGYLERGAVTLDIGKILARSPERHTRQVVLELPRNVLTATGRRLNDDATTMCLDWYGPARRRNATGGASSAGTTDTTPQILDLLTPGSRAAGARTTAVFPDRCGIEANRLRMPGTAPGGRGAVEWGLAPPIPRITRGGGASPSSRGRHVDRKVHRVRGRISDAPTFEIALSHHGRDDRPGSPPATGPSAARAIGNGHLPSVR